MKKTLIIGIIIVIGLVCIGINLKTTPRNTITVGAVLPLTGWGAYWAEPVTKGIELAVEDIQKKDGMSSFRVLVEDSQSAPKGAVSAASKLLSLNQVDAVYSEFSSLGSAISPQVQNSNKTLMYSAMTPKILEDNPLSVKTFVNIESACEKFSRHANQNGITKVAIYNKLADVAPACMKALLKTFPAENIKLNDNIQGNDFKTLLLKTKQFGAQAIIAIVVESDAQALIKQKTDLGITIPLFCHKSDCMTEKILSLYSDSLEGSVYFDSPVSEEFKQRYMERYGKIDPGLIEGAAFSYENMTYLYLAEKECKKDAECVAKYFENVRREGETALKGMRFENRMSVLDQEFYKIVGGKAEKLNW